MIHTFNNKSQDELVNSLGGGSILQLLVQLSVRYSPVLFELLHVLLLQLLEVLLVLLEEALLLLL